MMALLIVASKSMGTACTPLSRFVFLVCTWWFRSNALEGKDFHLHLAKIRFSPADKRQGSKTRRLSSQVCCTHSRNKSSSFPFNCRIIIIGFVSASGNMKNFQSNERKPLQISQHPKGFRSGVGHLLLAKQAERVMNLSVLLHKRVKHQPLWTITVGLTSAIPRLSRHSHPKSETSSGPKLCQSTIFQEKLLSQWISKKIPSENGQLALPSLLCSITVGDSSPSESQSTTASQGGLH